MNKKIKILGVILLLLSIACGTGIGNGFIDPTVPYGSSTGSSSVTGFSEPGAEYRDSAFLDCGSFTEDSSLAAVDRGRQCIRDSFSDCREAKYLLDKTNFDHSRFVSFVSIEKIPTDPNHCQLRVHTVSNVPPNPINNEERVCTVLLPNEYIETACGLSVNSIGPYPSDPVVTQQ